MSSTTLDLVIIMTRKQPLVKKYGHVMLGLAQAPEAYRQQMIHHAPSELINCISECCSNILKGNVTLTPAQKRKLRPKCQHLRLLADKKTSIQKKKRVLNQKGGILPLLALAPVIAKAVAYLKGDQHTGDDIRKGGFGYGADTRPDMNNTCVILEALETANVPKDDPVWKNVQAFIEQSQNRSETNKQPWF